MSWGLYATPGLPGLVYGTSLFRVSAGLTRVFGIMGILNSAHAAFYMLGAYLAWALVHLTGSLWRALAWPRSSSEGSGCWRPSGSPPLSGTSATPFRTWGRRR
jgi:ABC-type branched-subunit amino acid transport system permease subunit